MDTLARLPTSRLSAVTDQYLSSKLLLRPSQRAQAYLEGLVGTASVEPLAQQFILQKVLLAKVVPEEFFRKTLILLFSLRSPSLVNLRTCSNFCCSGNFFLRNLSIQSETLPLDQKEVQVTIRQ